MTFAIETKGFLVNVFFGLRLAIKKRYHLVPIVNLENRWNSTYDLSPDYYLSSSFTKNCLILYQSFRVLVCAGMVHAHTRELKR